MKVLEDAAAARTQLLRVESGPGQSLLLTFEAGRIHLRAEPRLGELSAELMEPGNASVPGTALDEEEPWWRLIGSPLVRVAEIADRGGVELQFRADADNPRVVEIVPKGAILHARLRPRDARPSPEHS